MSNIFLGKPLHWLMLVIIAAGLWWAGDLREHIVHFDAFIIALLAVSTVCVLIVLYGTRHTDRITRDEIVPDETELRLDDAAKREVAAK
jgi:Mn2+/Fe2+ NRAMP family transporter